MLEIQRSHVGEITVLDISGRIDAINSGLLQEAIDRVIEDGQGSDLLLKMTHVNYISAAGLRVLRELKAKTGLVRIVEPGIRVAEVMQITGLDVSYELYHTLKDALNKL